MKRLTQSLMDAETRHSEALAAIAAAPPPGPSPQVVQVLQSVMEQKDAAILQLRACERELAQLRADTQVQGGGGRECWWRFECFGRDDDVFVSVVVRLLLCCCTTGASQC